MGTNNMSATMPSNIPFALPLKRSQRALNAPRGGLSGTLGASGMSLTVSSNAISSDEALAAYYMQLYAQGTAFGQLQKESKKIHDPGILQSYDYFSHYITSLRSLGLNVTSASGQKVEAKSFSGSIKLSDILINVLSKYVSASQLADLTKLFDCLASTSDTQIVTLLDFWWDNVLHAENRTALAFGLLDIDNHKQPSYTVIYFSLNYSVSQWQSLYFSSSR
jgi:hypothetical protein